MKKDKIIYWITTGLIGLMMLFSAYNYFTNPEMQAAFVHLGFPDYFRIELGTAKILGVVALLLPITPSRIKEWAYAGFGLVFISAAIAHFASGDPTAMFITPLVLLGVLAVSYVYSGKLQVKA